MYTLVPSPQVAVNFPPPNQCRSLGRRNSGDGDVPGGSVPASEVSKQRSQGAAVEALCNGWSCQRGRCWQRMCGLRTEATSFHCLSLQQHMPPAHLLPAGDHVLERKSSAGRHSDLRYKKKSSQISLTYSGTHKADKHDISKTDEFGVRVPRPGKVRC